MEPTTSIKDGESTYRVEGDGRVLGWITKWHESDQVNKTGIKRFTARPICHAGESATFDAYPLAVSFLIKFNA